ncbi:MAG: hypothetical protein A3K04_11840 [Gallionellales bacterium RBG_16_56_9]|nr:MAG: hypothetical protein A3K04_11840 [Gallionellales bacterium RBG_16_56_9]
MLNLSLRTSVLLAAFVLSNGLYAAQALSPQTSNQSAVAVKVTPRNLQDPVWEFDVTFDTHSEELKDDLLKHAVLVAADGAQVAPVEWLGDPPGSHHRKGILRFNALRPVPGTVELRINRPGEPKPRSFQWELK